MNDAERFLDALTIVRAVMRRKKMGLYRKKPVTIHATQWWHHGDHAKVGPLPSSHPAWCDAVHGDDLGWIETLEGGHVVTPGDWIITGVKGEHYPCKPDIFEATYDPADSGEEGR